MYDAAENEISYFLSKVICDDYKGISMIVQGHFQKRVQTEVCIDSTPALAQDRELRRRAWVRKIWLECYPIHTCHKDDFRTNLNFK